MEQVQEQVNDQQVEATAEAPEQTPAINIEALQARLEKLENTNERLLNESKTYKNKYQGLRTDVETKQKTQLEESENWKELLDIEKNRAFELEEKNKSIRTDVMRQKLNFEVSRHASNAFDVNDVINSLDKSSLTIDEENLEVGGIKEAVEVVMKLKPHLFNTGVKPHGMGERPPEGYKEVKQETSLEDLILSGIKSGAI